MNDKRMIIRNCTALRGWVCNEQFIKQDKMIDCQDCTDYILKQIVEKCKRTLSINKGFENEFTLGKMTFAEFILKDIDMQEVE